jgi:hypothetical protein
MKFFDFSGIQFHCGTQKFLAAGIYPHKCGRHIDPHCSSMSPMCLGFSKSNEVVIVIFPDSTCPTEVLHHVLITLVTFHEEYVMLCWFMLHTPIYATYSYLCYILLFMLHTPIYATYSYLCVS